MSLFYNVEEDEYGIKYTLRNGAKLLSGFFLYGAVPVALLVAVIMPRLTGESSEAALAYLLFGMMLLILISVPLFLFGGPFVMLLRRLHHAYTGRKIVVTGGQVSYWSRVEYSIWFEKAPSVPELSLQKNTAWTHKGIWLFMEDDKYEKYILQDWAKPIYILFVFLLALFSFFTAWRSREAAIAFLVTSAIFICFDTWFFRYRGLTHGLLRRHIWGQKVEHFGGFTGLLSRKEYGFYIPK